MLGASKEVMLALGRPEKWPEGQPGASAARIMWTAHLAQKFASTVLALQRRTLLT